MSVDVVRAVRAQYPTPMTEEQCVRCSNEVAWVLNGRTATGPWGLRRKTSGTQYGGYALDVIVQREVPYGVDILIAAPTVADPSWQDQLPPPPEGWLAVWAPVRTDWLEAPPTPPPGGGELEARVLACEARLARLEARFRHAGEIMAEL